MASSSSSKPVTIVIHGGAWCIPDHLADPSISGVIRAAKRGYRILQAGGSALDAVEEAVVEMEDDPAFDAGTGSVLNRNGEVEMDALIMSGTDLKAGAIAAVQNIANPVKLARHVMEQTDHCLLVGQGANAFAKEMGIPEVLPDKLVTQESRDEFEELIKFKNTIQKRFSFSTEHNSKGDLISGHDTVGAVAMDIQGRMACATSTGGISCKQPGRVGDSPILGSGGYADDKIAAVSTTGHGEAIMKVCLAHHVTMNVQQGLKSQNAVENSLEMMKERVKGSGGAICVDKFGQPGFAFTTERMAWAYIQGEMLHYGLNPGEHFTENL